MSRTTNDWARLIYNALVNSNFQNSININSECISNWFLLDQDLGSSPPASGELGTNSPSLLTVTSLFLHKTCSSTIAINNDRSLFLSSLTNNIIYMQQDFNKQAYLKLTNVADSGSFYTLTVQPLVITNLFINAEPTLLSIYRL